METFKIPITAYTTATFEVLRLEYLLCRNKRNTIKSIDLENLLFIGHQNVQKTPLHDIMKLRSTGTTQVIDVLNISDIHQGLYEEKRP
jgi:hypothetical protein